jgi:hypothetical protein
VALPFARHDRVKQHAERRDDRGEQGHEHQEHAKIAAPLPGCDVSGEQRREALHARESVRAAPPAGISRFRTGFRGQIRRARTRTRVCCRARGRPILPFVGLFSTVRTQEPAAPSSRPAEPLPMPAIDPTNPRSWIIPELPPAYQEIAIKIEALRKDAQKYEDIAGVLWQVGRPLAVGVRDIFSELKFDAALTEHDHGFGAVVQLGNERRLVIMVAGSTEAIDRKDAAITELLRILQDDVNDRDRLVLALNAWCEIPLDARKQDLITPDALKLVQRVGANVVATSTLFGIWKYSLTDLEAARQSVMRLYSHDGGFFK